MIQTLEVQRHGQICEMVYNSPGHVREIEKNQGQFFEIHMLNAISKLSYRPGICLDIGANVGNHTVFFSRFCNFDEVWAYEPHKGSFEILKGNVARNCERTVRLFNCAVGAKKERRKIHKNKEHPSWSKLGPERGTTKVLPITTHLKVSLMKIDVEDFEFQVIEGAYDVIARELPELFIETHGDPRELLRMLPPAYRLLGRYNSSPTYHFSAV